MWVEQWSLHSRSGSNENLTDPKKCEIQLLQLTPKKAPPTIGGGFRKKEENSALTSLLVSNLELPEGVDEGPPAVARHSKWNSVPIKLLNRNLLKKKFLKLRSIEFCPFTSFLFYFQNKAKHTFLCFSFFQKIIENHS